MGQQTHASQQAVGLFDQFVGPARQGQRDGNAERFGCRQIDIKLDLGRLLNGQVDRLLPFENRPA